MRQTLQMLRLLHIYRANELWLLYRLELKLNRYLLPILPVYPLCRELGNSKTALGALIFIGFPWVGAYIIFYGALISIPNSLFEAAKIDGCGWWKRILTIDVPLISPQIKFVFVTSFIASVQNFGRVYVTTMGGPGHSTYIPILELFYNMSKFTNYGEAAAMGLFLFIVVFGATLMNLRMKTVSQ